MYLLTLSDDESAEVADSKGDGALFPPGLRLRSETAKEIYWLIVATMGKDFRWCFPDSPEILWDWSRLRTALESGSGWTLPDPAGLGLNAQARLTVQFVESSGSAIEPISFIAQPTGDAMLYELSNAAIGFRAPMTARRLAVDLGTAIKAQKERQLRERTKLQEELAATAQEEESLEDELELDEELGGSDLVELFEALAMEESAPKPTVRRLTHRERMDRLRHQRSGKNPRTI